MSCIAGQSSLPARTSELLDAVVLVGNLALEGSDLLEVFHLHAGQFELQLQHALLRCSLSGRLVLLQPCREFRLHEANKKTKTK